jgi:3-oxoacyl-(acyl-carrier-protein) synthase
MGNVHQPAAAVDRLIEELENAVIAKVYGRGDGVAAAKAALRAAAPAAQPSVQIDLTEDAAKFLRDTLNSGDDEPPEITLAVTHGHSGYGLYQWETEYPEEGANLLQAIAAELPEEPTHD